MTFLLIAVSSLALLAATVCVILLVREKKRSEKRKAVFMQYIESVRNELFEKFDKRITALENGVVPDFEQAKAAADAVNNFNAGITGILGFDPHEVLKKQRNNPAGGENG